MKILSTTKLRIRDQNELLNQIAGTYKDFFRVAMEYVDNSIDASEILRRNKIRTTPRIDIVIDTEKKTVSFTDNCGGMSSKELCNLLSEVGRSTKKAVPWANGQFGFGVHAFRAFAKKAEFVSWKDGEPEASISIDRDIGEEEEVACVETPNRMLKEAGTRVTISKFNSHVFKKAIFKEALINEVTRHFDDVLRARLIEIYVREDKKTPTKCSHFDYEKLPGLPLKKTVEFNCDGKNFKLDVDLKILEKSQNDRLPVLCNKQRRVQTLGDLKSYKNFVRLIGHLSYVWGNPFVVGRIEINDACSPNLTRDDLSSKDIDARETLYQKIYEIQCELDQIVNKALDEKAKDSYKKLGQILSDQLANIMKSFKLSFLVPLPSGTPGDMESSITMVEEGIGLGEDDKQGGIIVPKEHHGEGNITNPTIEPGPDDKGGDGSSGLEKKDGTSTPQPRSSHAPQIQFQNHADEDRVIDLGHSLVVNTQHPDFKIRNQQKDGKIQLNVRLLNYVSVIIGPLCIHKLFEKRGKVPTDLEFGHNCIEFSMKLEEALASSPLLNQTIEGSI